MTVSRRVLRKTLNDALAIAGNAVQLDASGEYQRSIEAYQQSVDLLEHGISLMRLQREVGGERPGRDTTHEISQLEQIVRLGHEYCYYLSLTRTFSAKSINPASRSISRSELERRQLWLQRTKPNPVQCRLAARVDHGRRRAR